jgi:hypothetical protein
MLFCQINNPETPNLVWVLLTLFSWIIIELLISNQLVTDQQIIPFWTGYFRVISKSSPSFSKVAYPPIVDAKPTDMTTVYTSGIVYLTGQHLDICISTADRFYTFL